MRLRTLVAFRRDGVDLTVSATIDFAVKVLGFAACARRPRPGNQERRCLLVGPTQTDDNGTKYTVRAQRTANGVDVQRTSGAR